MPKIHNTRLQRANELLTILENGPAFSFNNCETSFSTDDAKHDYNLWVKTWVIPNVVKLIPELRLNHRKAKS